MNKKPIRNATTACTVSLILALGVGGCQTSAPAPAVERRDGSAYVFVSQDERAASPKAKKSSMLKNAEKNLKAKAEKDEGADGRTLNALAQVALASGDTKTATARARKALEADFRLREARVVLALVAYLEKRSEDAKALARQLGGEAAPESEVLNLLACLSYAEGDTTKAEALFTKATQLNGDDVAARMNLGLLLLEREQPAAAATQFLAILKRAPGNPDATIHLGVAYAMQGKLAKAEETYRDVDSSAKDNPVLLFNLALVQKRAGKYDDAIDTMQKYMALKRLRLSDRGQAIALLEDIKFQRAVTDPDAGKKVDKILAGQKSRRDTSTGPSEPGFFVTSVGAVTE